MIWSYLPPYGHACCPHCRQEFSLLTAQPTFMEKAPHNDILVYVMCQDCHAIFQTGDDQIRKEMSNACFTNFKVRGACADGGMLPFAITTSMTLALNDWQILAAIENGHGLTRSEYFSICSHAYEIITLPGGLRVIHLYPLQGDTDEKC